METKTHNSPAYTAYGSLLRERKRLTEARDLPAEIHALHPNDAYAAEALAAVYLDIADDRRDPSLPVRPSASPASLISRSAARVEPRSQPSGRSAPDRH